MYRVSHIDPSNLGVITKSEDMTLDELVQRLSTPTATSKADQPLVIGATFTGTRRVKGECTGRNVLPIDLDDGRLSFDEAVAKLQTLKVAGIVHETASHGIKSDKNPDGGPRLRIFVPLSRPLTAEEWPRAQRWMTEVWNADASAIDLPRISYAPIVGSQCVRVDRDVLDADTIPPALPPAPVVASVPVASIPIDDDDVERVRAAVAPSWPAKGKRHAARLALAGCLVSAGWSDADIVAVMPVPDGADERVAIVVSTRRAATRTGWPRLAELVGAEGQRAIGDAVAACDAVRKALDKSKAKALAPRGTDTTEDLCKQRPAGDKLAPIELSNLVFTLSSRDEWKHSHTATGEIAPVIALDTFTGDRVMRESAPIEASARLDRERRWSDADTLRLKQWLELKVGVKPSPEMVEGASTLVAESNPINTVGDWLDALGASRAGSIDELAGVLGLQSNIERKMLRKWLIGACARAYEPGVFVKSALVLYGKQDAGKSSALEILCGSRHFGKINGDMSDAKIVGEKLARKWIVEIEEADSLTRTEIEAMKSCISATHDDYRGAYERHAKRRARTCIFAVSTNRSDILRDETGDVRFWCTAVANKIDLKRVNALRNAVWCEARDAYKAGEAWHFTDEADRRAAAERADMMREVDVLEDSIADYLKGRTTVTTAEVITHVSLEKYSALVKAGAGRLDHRVSKSLRRLGCEPFKRGERGWDVPCELAGVAKRIANGVAGMGLIVPTHPTCSPLTSGEAKPVKALAK